ncbi:AMP-binding protein [bacterium]|nr:AMP-binding protein [bacterium]
MGLRQKNILSLLDDKTNDYLDRVALGTKTPMGWKEFTYKGVGMLSRKLASHMIEDLDTQKGDRVAILSESMPEYGACLFASALAGMTVVPLDIKLTKYELTSILSDCEPTVMLTSLHYLETAKEIQKTITSIKHILVMDEQSYYPETPSIHSLPNRYDAKWRRRSSKSTALIIYTSGTTGSPKGVEISYNNIFSQLEDLKVVMDHIIPTKHCKMLSILPMNHLFELTVGFSTFLNLGYSVYYALSLKPKDILAIMREKQINFMIVVPAFLKLLKTSIESELKNSSAFKKALFNFKFNLAQFIPFMIVRRLMFRDIHKQFGRHFKACLSGGAPLDIQVGKWFSRLGIKVYQGYGLSECSPVVSMNYDKRHDLASVGRPLTSLETKIDSETGELLVKGPAVMKGYHNQPELTSQAVTEDGWLHTGDIAEIRGGHIYITGRIKNMIVLSGGKKVFPEEVEAVLEKSPYFKEVCVFGHVRTFGSKDGTEEVTAVVVPTDDILSQYSNEDAEKFIKGEVKQLAMKLTAYKRPVNVIVYKEPLPRTATNKVKRKEVKKLVTV